jgi:hypothetical protein
MPSIDRDQRLEPVYDLPPHFGQRSMLSIAHQFAKSTYCLDCLGVFFDHFPHLSRYDVFAPASDNRQARLGRVKILDTGD